jgi:predicted ATP-binding protein involved in virulence
MIVKRLKLTNLRAIEAAELRFQPGFNLIVGINGVGKTTVLHAISRGLAQAIGAAEGMRTTPPEFTERDIRYGSLDSSLTLDLDIGASAMQVVEDWTRSDASTTRPGELASDVDVHAKDVRRRGRLRKAQREALATTVRGGGPRFLPAKATFKSGAKHESSRLMSVFFSTTRALTPAQTARKSRAVRASAAAYTDAFVGRELGVGAFAEWLKVLRTTAHERDDAGPILQALDEAVRRFLPGYLGLRVSGDDPPRLLIDRTERSTVRANKLPLNDRQRLVQVLRRMREHMDVNWPPKEIDKLSPREVAKAAAAEREGVVAALLKAEMPAFEALRGPLDEVPAEISKVSYFDEFYETLGQRFEVDQLPESLDVAQLSDGERGVLALVLDLTRRLAQANPRLKDPASESEAVVLIDELELHLHPTWQRNILQSLTETFPKCQFIATTHSPQIIGAVSHTGVTLLIEHGTTIRPSQTLGMDANWILRHVMEADERKPEVRAALDAIFASIRKGDNTKARAQIATLRAKIGENPDLAAADAMASRAELLADPISTPRRTKRARKPKR